MPTTRFPAEVLTPEGSVFAEDVVMVSTRTTLGQIGIMARHAPLLGRLEPTELRLYRADTEIVRYAQGEGYVQVADGRVLVLVEEAVEQSRLDQAALQQRIATARHALDAAPADSEQAARAALELRRAETFLAIAAGGHR